MAVRICGLKKTIIIGFTRDFKKIESPLDWDVYFESMGLAGLKELDAKQINFYKDMSEALRNTTVDEQKYYLRLIY